MSLRALLTGFVVGAGAICAAADAASNSKTGITRVLFILSSCSGESVRRAPLENFITSSRAAECPATVAFPLSGECNATRVVDAPAHGTYAAKNLCLQEK